MTDHFAERLILEELILFRRILKAVRSADIRDAIPAMEKETGVLISELKKKLSPGN